MIKTYENQEDKSDKISYFAKIKNLNLKMIKLRIHRFECRSENSLHTTHVK